MFLLNNAVFHPHIALVAHSVGLRILLRELPLIFTAYVADCLGTLFAVASGVATDELLCEFSFAQLAPLLFVLALVFLLVHVEGIRQAREVEILLLLCHH